MQDVIFQIGITESLHLDWHVSPDYLDHTVVFYKTPKLGIGSSGRSAAERIVSNAILLMMMPAAVAPPCLRATGPIWVPPTDITKVPKKGNPPLWLYLVVSDELVKKAAASAKVLPRTNSFATTKRHGRARAFVPGTGSVQRSRGGLSTSIPEKNDDLRNLRALLVFVQ